MKSDAMCTELNTMFTSSAPATSFMTKLWMCTTICFVQLTLRTELICIFEIQKVSYYFSTAIYVGFKKDFVKVKM